jgi:hypothetical protein
MALTWNVFNRTTNDKLNAESALPSAMNTKTHFNCQRQYKMFYSFVYVLPLQRGSFFVPMFVDIRTDRGYFQGNTGNKQEQGDEQWLIIPISVL